MRLLTIVAMVSIACSALAENSRCLIPGVDPGKAKASKTADGYTLKNKLVGFSVLVKSGAVAGAASGGNMPGGSGGGVRLESLFELKDSSGRATTSRTMKLAGDPVIQNVQPKSSSPKLADHLAGKEIVAHFISREGGLRADWSVTLLDGSNYVRESCTFTAVGKNFEAASICMLEGTIHSLEITPRSDSINPDLKVSGAEVTGTVPGSPVVTKYCFCGLEDPSSVSTLSPIKGSPESVFRCSVERKIPINPDAPVTYSAVIGVAPEGQMRRAFLNYVERERAHPYRPFLHYNSWLDISYGLPFTANQSVDSIEAFGTELTEKRGVKLSSFLFDDGWDDTHTVWKFNNGFPDGFTPLKEAAAKYSAGPGVWLSPWGGYGDARTQRLATGTAAGYEIDKQGYALSGPKYFERFRQVCLDFVKQYGVNQFKFDGTGSADKHTPGSKFDSDFDAAIQLIQDLRDAKPDLFINLTTGTWPSPFWLRYADSTWRGGEDSSFAGVGTKRQQWITYRDWQTYQNVVLRGPLYPISSLMLHGIIYAKEADGLQTDPGDDFRDEVRSYFGSGTQLQEMYITHSSLTNKNWDDLAEAAKWSQANADELVDTHWIGGNPKNLEVYGWAAWCPRKASVVLRNPSDKPQDYDLELGKALDINGTYKARSPWKGDAAGEMMLESGRAETIHLKPFEVKVLDLYPVH
jgi:hypothetical protein